MSRTSTASSSLPSDPPGRAPANPSEVRDRLGALGIRPSKRRGQSFLSDAFVADAEAALLEVPPGAAVLEIGGGLGVLTEALRRRGIGPITVLEIDPRLARHLRETFAPEVRVVVADALEFPLGGFAAVIGNLPYSLATPILLRTFAARVPRVVAMVQAEVADRLAAGPGSRSYGRLSIAARLYGTIELFRSVGPASFVPHPSVASRILRFRGREGPLPVGSTRTLETVVRTLFQARRKQLGNLLPKLTPDPESTAKAARWPPNWDSLRPEALAPEAFFELSNVLDRARDPDSP